MAADVRIIDKGFAAVVKSNAKLAGKEVRVGYQAGSGKDVLDIAIFNEFGTRTAPARPFMAQTARKNGKRTAEAMRRVAAAVAAGQDPNPLLSHLGEFYQNLIKKEISSGDFVANAPGTVKAKGSSKPLVDTGRVLSPAVRWVVK